jgi:exonuclease SbcD
MKLLHTSDWHIGQMLYDKRRYAEFEGFLDWLLKLLKTEKVDTILVSGDVFDTVLPSNLSQELYFGFLARAAKSGCQNIVVTGGNHDSPSLLNASKELLKAFNIRVVGAATESIEDELVVLKDLEGQPTGIVCAVPYLRERDVRKYVPGEDLTATENRLRTGIIGYYEAVVSLALKKKAELEAKGAKGLPIIGMGHLFASGGSVSDGDGVRELYVGNLLRVEASEEFKSFDYLALGHLHRAQMVNKLEHIRYSGSPLPMSFSELGVSKKVVLVEFDGVKPTIKEVEVPRFQRLEKLKGDLPSLLEQIKQLKNQKESIWLDIEYDGDAGATELRLELFSSVERSKLEILNIKNIRVIKSAFMDEYTMNLGAQLTPEYVFDKLLEDKEISDKKADSLRSLFQKLLQTYHEKDVNAI